MIPSLITFIGSTLSLAWLAGALPWWCGLLGLLCDVLDGGVARMRGEVSRFGSVYDWTVDVVIAGLCVSQLALMWPRAVVLLALLIPLQVYARLRGWRVSGRAVLTVLLLLARWYMVARLGRLR